MEQPQLTRDELLRYCVAYQDSIMVRDTVDGHTGNYPLSALTLRAAGKHIKRWLAEGRLPHRTVKPVSAGEAIGRKSRATRY